jgi:hypothetical protein
MMMIKSKKSQIERLVEAVAELWRYAVHTFHCFTFDSPMQVISFIDGMWVIKFFARSPHLRSCVRWNLL